MLFGDGYPIDMQNSGKGAEVIASAFFLTRGDKI
jgi:hypothetical protein